MAGRWIRTGIVSAPVGGSMMSGLTPLPITESVRAKRSRRMKVGSLRIDTPSVIRSRKYTNESAPPPKPISTPTSALVARANPRSGLVGSLMNVVSTANRSAGSLVNWFTFTTSKYCGAGNSASIVGVLAVRPQPPRSRSQRNGDSSTLSRGSMTASRTPENQLSPSCRRSSRAPACTSRATSEPRRARIRSST